MYSQGVALRPTIWNACTEALNGCSVLLRHLTYSTLLLKALGDNSTVMHIGRCDTLQVRLDHPTNRISWVRVTLKFQSIQQMSGQVYGIVLLEARCLLLVIASTAAGSIVVGMWQRSRDVSGRQLMSCITMQVVKKVRCTEQSI